MPLAGLDHVAHIQRGAPNLLAEPDGAAGDQHLCPAVHAPAALEVPPTARAALHAGIGRISEAMDRAPFFVDLLPGAVDPQDNPEIPAGYTYLLQFIAHDIVQSGGALGIAASRGSYANGRGRPLMLDTLYGAGPDGAPQLYQPLASDRGPQPRPEIGLMSRKLLAVGSQPDGVQRPAAATCLPWRDIARDNQKFGDPTYPLIGDMRNDAHAVMSQLTLLFHLLHNHVMLEVDAALARAGTPTPDVETAGRAFACARAVTTLLYRRLIRRDLLTRVLDRETVEAYEANDGRPLFGAFSEVPVEFSRAAFRLGHAMVRDRYRVNALPFVSEDGPGLFETSRRRGGKLPLDEDWMIDWAFFFDLAEAGGPARPDGFNFSRRIGPCYPEIFQKPNAYTAPTIHDRPGLAHRDLLAGGYSAMWTVAALRRELAARLTAVNQDALAARLPPFGAPWRNGVLAWLAANQAPGAPPADLAALAADPPLLLALLMEAAQPVLDDGSPGPNGRSFGPMGSLLVAETLYGALHGMEVVPGEWALSLPDAISAASTVTLGLPDLLPRLMALAGDPITMPRLLLYMRSAGLFA